MGQVSEILQIAAQRSREQKADFQGAVTPREAWTILQHAPGARIIDIRSRAELDWVGRIPQAIEIEWQTYPGMKPNPYFLTELQRATDKESMLLFICRSGARSKAAASAATQAGFANCFNVLEGFEGDKDANNHRGTIGGWRHSGLPWTQS